MENRNQGNENKIILGDSICTMDRMDWDRINLKPEIKSMIENLQDELYQLEKKQVKGDKLRANIR